MTQSSIELKENSRRLVVRMMFLKDLNVGFFLLGRHFTDHFWGHLINWNGATTKRNGRHIVFIIIVIVFIHHFDLNCRMEKMCNFDFFCQSINVCSTYPFRSVRFLVRRRSNHWNCLEQQDFSLPPMVHCSCPAVSRVATTPT